MQRSLLLGGLLGFIGSATMGGGILAWWFTGQQLPAREAAARIASYTITVSVVGLIAGMLTGAVTFLLLSGTAGAPHLPLAAGVVGAVAGAAAGGAVGFAGMTTLCTAVGARPSGTVIGAAFVGFLAALLGGITGIPIGLVVARGLPGR